MLPVGQLPARWPGPAGGPRAPGRAWYPASGTEAASPGMSKPGPERTQRPGLGRPHGRRRLWFRARVT
jgi:hypothetical protein